MIFLVLILLAGGGGGFYYWRVRAASKARAAKEAAAKKDAPGDQHGKTETAAGGDAEVTQVIELQPFIVNLADKNESRYLRMSISLGVAENGAKLKWIRYSQPRYATPFWQPSALAPPIRFLP